MIQMNFITYLSFKYKLTRHNSTGARKAVAADWVGMFFFLSALVGILVFIIELFPPSIQHNMNKYIVGFFAFLCLISISTSIKKYYKEYFLSPEREILLIAPIKHSQIILSRFFVVSIEVLMILSMFLFPFILANYIAGNITLEIVLITIIQIITGSIFFSTIAHFVYAFAFLISKGKGLRVIAYTLTTGASVGVISIIIYLKNYKAFLFTENSILEVILYILFRYPQYLLTRQLDFQDVGMFTVFTVIHSFCSLLVAYWMTNYCYKKGLLTISSRDLEKSYYGMKISDLIHKLFKNDFIKKDLLYLIRSPKLFSVYVSPLLFTSVIEYRNQFASSGIAFVIFISIFSLIITTVTLHILMSDDVEHQDLLFSIPFQLEELYKKRSSLLYILSLIISGTYLFTICLLEYTTIEMLVFGMVELFFLTYLASRVLLSKVMRRSIKAVRGYWYTGAIVKPVLSYFILWNLPLIVYFSCLHEVFNIFLEKNELSRQAAVVSATIFIILIIMFYKSIKLKIIVRRMKMAKEDKQEKTLGQKISTGFTILCIIFLILRFTGLLDPVIAFFKN